MKTLRGKLIMAAIILSCGLAMHADPSAQREKAKRAALAAAKNWQMVRTAEASTRPASAKRPELPEDLAAR